MCDLWLCPLLVDPPPPIAQIAAHSSGDSRATRVRQAHRDVHGDHGGDVSIEMRGGAVAVPHLVNGSGDGASTFGGHDSDGGAVVTTVRVPASSGAARDGDVDATAARRQRKKRADAGVATTSSSGGAGDGSSSSRYAAGGSVDHAGAADPDVQVSDRTKARLAKRMELERQALEAAGRRPGKAAR